MVTWALFRTGPQPSGRLLAIGWVALRGSRVTVVLILVAWRKAVVRVQVVVVVMVGVGVVMVVVVVVAVVVVVVVVGVVVVAGQSVSSTTLASHWRAAVTDRRKLKKRRKELHCRLHNYKYRTRDVPFSKLVKTVPI